VVLVEVLPARNAGPPAPGCGPSNRTRLIVFSRSAPIVEAIKSLVRKAANR